MSMSDLNPWAAEWRRGLRCSPPMTGEERLLWLAAKVRGKPLDYTEPPRRPHRRTRPLGEATASTLLTSREPLITLADLDLDDVITCIRADDCVSQERRDELVRRVEALRRPKRARTRKRPSVRWLSPRAGLHLIGRHRIDDPRFARALDAAWLAVSNPGQRHARALDFCMDAAHTGESLRHALRKAAKYLQPFDARVAAAVDSISIMDDVLLFVPGEVDIRTS